MYSKKSFIPSVQRALVLQGGGALGAYQAGVFKSLYEKLKTQQDGVDGNEHIFDIIAVTSIGAINGAILTSYFVENNTWNGAGEKLESFWRHLSTPTPDISKTSRLWKEEFEKQNPFAATQEGARRYYSVKEFLKSGVENVFRPIYPPKEDNRFFDSQNKWLIYDKTPLRKSIEQYAKFPISTSFEKGEPRLLVISVNIEEGISTTFDSYKNSSGDKKAQSNETIFKTKIKSDNGIDIKHVIASASLPGFYTSEDIDGNKYCDGGVLSNTPMKEILEAHRLYWSQKISEYESYQKLDRETHHINSTNQEEQNNIPDLELYIINILNPGKDANKKFEEHDEVIDRYNDIILKENSDYIASASIISDYLSLIQRLIDLGKEDKKIKQKIDAILDEDTPRRFPTEGFRKYMDLINNSIRIVKIVRIERKDDIHTISGKMSVFTIETVEKLIEEGYHDALIK